MRDLRNLRRRTDVHDKSERRRKEHIGVKEIAIKSAWEDMRFVVPKEEKIEKQQETRLTPEEEKTLKQAHDIAEKKKEESRRLSEKWTEKEMQQTSKEEKRGKRRDSPECANSEPRYRSKREDEGRARINMIRLKPAEEVTLTPAPGWEEAEGRPVQGGEDDIAEVEVRFQGRK